MTFLVVLHLFFFHGVTPVCSLIFSSISFPVSLLVIFTAYILIYFFLFFLSPSLLSTQFVSVSLVPCVALLVLFHSDFPLSPCFYCTENCSWMKFAPHPHATLWSRGPYSAGIPLVSCVFSFYFQGYFSLFHLHSYPCVLSSPYPLYFPLLLLFPRSLVWPAIFSPLVSASGFIVGASLLSTLVWRI